MIPIETVLGRLGSRFCLNLRPQDRSIRHGALGRFCDESANLVIGVECDNGRRVLPLSRDGQVFESVRMELTMTSVTFRCESPALEVELDVTFRAPFYPRDIEISTAPVFYIEIQLRPLAGRLGAVRQTGREMTLFVAIRRPGARIETSFRGFDIAYSTAAALSETAAFESPAERAGGPDSSAGGTGQTGQTSRTGLADWPGPGDRTDPTDGSARLDFAGADHRGERSVQCRERLIACTAAAQINDGAIEWKGLLESEPLRISLAWVAFVDEAVFLHRGRPCRLLGSAHFESLDSLSRWACDYREELAAHCRFFDSVFATSSLSKTQQDLMAFGFQSWLMNTWWVIPEGSDEDDFFGVWNGRGRRLSPIDIEYNNSIFYLLLWPDLLARLLSRWLENERPGPATEGGLPTGFLARDLGGGFHADGSGAPRETPVEANADFLLMLHAFWKWTGRFPLADTQTSAVARLFRFLVAADVTDDGFPEEGVVNGFDDAPAALHFARGQTYFGVKVLSAARCVVELAAHLGDAALGRDADLLCRRALETLEEEAWQGDHYAACIDPSASGLIDPRTGTPPAFRRLEAWNAWSIHTANGLLLPLLSAPPGGIDPARMVRDIRGAMTHCAGEYGCCHSSAVPQSPWVSQNLWRDLAAAYLGLDLLLESERYWSFQIHRNATAPGHAFLDHDGPAPPADYSPRGALAIGLLAAAVGLRIDAQSRRVTLRPIRIPARIPLLPFTDWERGVMLWVEGTLDSGRARCTFINRELLEGWTLEIDFTSGQPLWQQTGGDAPANPSRKERP